MWHVIHQVLLALTWKRSQRRSYLGGAVNKRSISMSELQEAVERIGMGGPERRSRLISERVNKMHHRLS